jgi:hypothetical protein
MATALAAAIAADTAEANKGITHAEFAAGVRNKTIGFMVTSGEAFELIMGARRTRVLGIMAMYSVAPLILVPVWALLERNWWILTGIPLSWAGTQFAVWSQVRQTRNPFGWITVLGFSVSCVTLGAHNLVTTLFACAFWGYFFFAEADRAQEQGAIRTLVERPDLFDAAIAKGRIRILRRERVE